MLNSHYGVSGSGRMNGQTASPAVRGFGVEDGTGAALYVPIQTYSGMYPTSTGFCRGTMFPELDKPFYGAGGEVNCRGQA